jgi:hypothetical protein
MADGKVNTFFLDFTCRISEGARQAQKGKRKEGRRGEGMRGREGNGDESGGD